MTRASRRPFYALFGIILAVVAAFTVYWFVALDQAKLAFTDFVRAEQARGHAVEFSAISWGGYPIRLAAQITGLRYAAGGTEIEAGNVRFEVMPWNPTDVLVRAEGNVRVAMRDTQESQRIELRPEIIIARLNVTTAGALETAAVEMRSAQAQGSYGRGTMFAFAARRLQIDVRAAGGTGPGRETYEAAFSADAVALGEGITPLLGPAIASIRMAVRMSELPPFAQGFRPVDRTSLIGVLAANGAAAEVARLDMDWGGVSAKGTGRLQLDRDKRPIGRLDFNVVNLNRLISALQTVDAVQSAAPALPDAPGGTPIPLVLNGGVVTFGPLTLGTLEPLN